MTINIDFTNHKENIILRVWDNCPFRENTIEKIDIHDDGTVIILTSDGYWQYLYAIKEWRRI